jgi:hypothetical protein
MLVVRGRAVSGIFPAGGCYWDVPCGRLLIGRSLREVLMGHSLPEAFIF